VTILISVIMNIHIILNILLRLVFYQIQCLRL